MTTSLTWKTKEINVATFYSMLSEMSKDRIDCDPIGQRPDVESMTKRQGIMDTVFRGYDFGELKLRTLPDGKDFKYRSIDGGHRKRAIRDFILGKYRLGKNTQCLVDGQSIDISNKYYRELPQEVKDILSNYKIRCTVYGQEMTDEEAGETFRRTNITTDVNHQEMLNSYEDNLVAKYVRETSRPIRGLHNEYHDLFEYTSTEPENRKQRYWQSASTRLRDDEFVTRLLTMLSKDEKDQNMFTCGNKETENFFLANGDSKGGIWLKNPNLAKKQQNMVNESLDFFVEYIAAKKAVSKSLMSTQEFTLVSRFYVYLVKTFKSFKVTDYEELYSSIRSAMDRFVGRDENNLRTDTHKDNKGIRTVTECFRQYLTVHDDEIRCRKSVQWLLEEMDINDCGILFLDNKRAFPADMIEQIWRQQGKKCWVTGEPLSLKDAAGGHIIAHSAGGKTEVANCMVCHKDENTRMGAMDATMYRAMRKQELEQV
jgi:hypothetical protein